MQADAGAFSWLPCGVDGGKYTEVSVSKIATTRGKMVCALVNAVCPHRQACHNARLVGKDLTGACAAMAALRRTLRTCRLMAASRSAASMTGITCCTSLFCTSMTHVRNASICTCHLIGYPYSQPGARVEGEGEGECYCAIAIAKAVGYPNLPSEIAQALLRAPQLTPCFEQHSNNEDTCADRCGHGCISTCAAASNAPAAPPATYKAPTSSQPSMRGPAPACVRRVVGSSSAINILRHRPRAADRSGRQQDLTKLHSAALLQPPTAAA